MSNSIKTLKRYYKAALNMIFNKTFLGDFKKKFISRIVFFVSKQNFTTKHVKIV